MKLTHSDVQKWATEIADGVDDLVVDYLADGWFATWERTLDLLEYREDVPGEVLTELVEHPDTYAVEVLRRNRTRFA